MIASAAVPKYFFPLATMRLARLPLVPEVISAGDVAVELADWGTH